MSSFILFSICEIYCTLSYLSKWVAHTHSKEIMFCQISYYLPKISLLVYGDSGTHDILSNTEKSCITIY